MLRKFSAATAVLALGLLAAPSASALDILLTNDDGWDAPGIQTLYGALVAAGHQVTLVAPLENQSGTGGSLITDPGEAVPVFQHAPGQWSVESTPSDSVRAGLALLGREPELIVSGLNFGQNLGQPTSNASGTVGAALLGAYSGIPAIAASVGLDFSTLPDLDPTPTFLALGPAAGFVVDVIAALEADRGDDSDSDSDSERGARSGLLPKGVKLLNINFPVPYGDIRGVKLTRLGAAADFDFPWLDATGVAGCSAPCGGALFVGFTLTEAPDAVRGADVDAHRNGFISITGMDGDMTSSKGAIGRLRGTLRRLEP